MKRFTGAAVMIALILLIAFVSACSKTNEQGFNGNDAPTASADGGTDDGAAAGAADYAFGENQTFHSNEPVDRKSVV